MYARRALTIAPGRFTLTCSVCTPPGSTPRGTKCRPAVARHPTAPTRRAVAAECRTLGRATPTGASKRRRWRGSVLAMSSAVAAATGRLRIKGRKWPVVVLICLTVAGILLFLAQDPRTLHVVSRLPARTRPFRTTSRASSTAQSPAETPTTLLQNGRRDLSGDARGDRQARTPDCLRDLQLQTRRDRGDASPRRSSTAARRGVMVRIVLDSFGATPPPTRSRRALRRPASRLPWFNVLGLWTVEATNNRTHRKILVVDGEIGFTGGAGVADHWLGDADAPDHWRDTQFTVNGPAVRWLEACFFENWVEAGGADAPELDLEEPRGRRPGALARDLEQPDRRRQQRQAALPLFDRRGHGARSRSSRPTSSRTRPPAGRCSRRGSAGVEIRVLTDGDDHGREVGETCEPQRVPAAPRRWRPDLRVPRRR